MTVIAQDDHLTAGDWAACDLSGGFHRASNELTSTKRSAEV